MFKLVVLFSVVALAAAKPSAVLPLAYSATVLPGSSSLSQYSTSVVHGAPLAHGLYGSHLLAPSAYSYGPALALAQPAHAPAVVLDAFRGVPLDTPEVVAARAAHFQAKALSGHHLHKRSLAPLSYNTLGYSAPLSYGAAPLLSAYSSPLLTPYASTGLLASSYGYGYGLLPRALSVHPY